MADVTAREFADAHQGLAPIIVMPDPNGSVHSDTECVNSPRGNAETYLTVDVPNFMRTHFTLPDQEGLNSDRRTVGGWDVLDNAGPSTPRHLHRLRRLLRPDQSDGGRGRCPGRRSSSSSPAQQPTTGTTRCLLRKQAPETGGWFEVGTADSAPLAAQRKLVPLSIAAGIYTCYVEVPGEGHDFDLWERAFRDSLPFLSWRLGLTPKPATIAPESSGQRRFPAAAACP